MEEKAPAEHDPLSEGFALGSSAASEASPKYMESRREPFDKTPAPSVARVIDFIEAYLERDLDLDTLAGVAAMSTYHFARSFKEAVGMSPHAYVLGRRVARAAQLLNQDKPNLARIAVLCGFSSQAHLTTSFRLCYGVTPGAYRRNCLRRRMQ